MSASVSVQILTQRDKFKVYIYVVMLGLN